MRTPCLALSLLLLLAGVSAASAQGGEDESDTCWQCPTCGTVFSLSPYEVENIDPYSICPACGMAYAIYFAQVPCQDPAYEYYEDNYEIYHDDYEGDTEQDTTLVQELDSQDSSNGQSGETFSPAGLKTTDEPISGSQIPADKGRILMVVPQQDYQEDELNIPRDYFQRSGYDVDLASKGVKTATGMDGGNVSIDLDLQEADVSLYEAVVFVGGEGIYYLNLNEDPSYQALAKEAADQNKLIGAICLAPWILADSDLLTGKSATASDTDYIKSKGAKISDQPVVRDANIITASGPSAAQEFAEAIIAALEEEEKSEEGLSQENLSGAYSVPLGTEEEASQDQQPASLPDFKCANCAYVYDPAQGDPDSGIEPGTPFERLPAGWKCPWCGAGKDQFVRA